MWIHKIIQDASGRQANTFPACADSARQGDDAQSSAKRTEENVYKGFSIPEYR
ncbi:hypothetical protein JS565_05685 [Salmonella enterica subsp. enterica serovar Senftenberg]|nr:hypothetical protein [Salmonella enterica subsp. enterica serovar Senftenberg]